MTDETHIVVEDGLPLGLFPTSSNAYLVEPEAPSISPTPQFHSERVKFDLGGSIEVNKHQKRRKTFGNYSQSMRALPPLAQILRQQDFPGSGSPGKSSSRGQGVKGSPSGLKLGQPHIPKSYSRVAKFPLGKSLDGPSYFNDALCGKLKKAQSVLDKDRKLFAISPEMMAENTYEITFRLISTWGEKNIVSLSEIDILDESRNVLPVLSIKAYPPSSSDPQKLVNGNLVKRDSKDFWNTTFDPEVGAAVVITVAALKDPCFVRIWNNSNDPNSSLKKYEVFIENKFITGGDLPCSFGQIVSLFKPEVEMKPSVNDIQSILEMFEDMVKPKPPEILKDIWGLLPAQRVSKISIKFMKTFEGGAEIGLNALQFYGFEGKLIDIRDNATLNVNGITCRNSLRNLFTDNPARSDPNRMWRGILVGSIDQCSLDIIFEKKIYICMIKIFNYNGSGEPCTIGPSRIKVLINDRLYFVGPIKKANGVRADVDQTATKIELFEPKDQNRRKI